MTSRDFVLALTPDGSRVEIFRGAYGPGQHAPIHDGALTLEENQRRVRAWRHGLLTARVSPSSKSSFDSDYDTTTREVSRERRGSAAVPFDAEIEGQRLFDILLPDGLRENFRNSLAAAQGGGRPLHLRLILRLDPGFEHLHALPWELLWDAHLGDALARHAETPFVRAPAVPRSNVRPVVEPPLRLLLVFPQPRNLLDLDVESERRAIEAELEQSPIPIEIESVSPPATLESLHDDLLGFRPHVLHFGGHGAFNANGEGCLCFEDRSKAARRVPGKIFAEALKDCPSLGLVVLNACHTADLSEPGLSPAMAVAGATVAAGRCAVIAMQAPIRDRAALSFSAAFYDRLGGGDPLDLAANSARNRLFLENPSSPEWATPVVYLRSDDARVVRPAGEPRPAPATLRKHIRDVSVLVRSKTRNFVGRGFVFEALQNFLETDGGCFLLEGDPGIGKTTLLAEMLRRRRMPHHFIEYGSASASRAEHALTNLSAQLIQHYKLPYTALPPDAGRSSDFLLRLLGESLHQKGPDRRLVLMIDALDELEFRPGHEGNVLDLPRHLPQRVYLILSKRRDKRVHFRFDGRLVPMEVLSQSEENIGDIEAFVRQYLPRRGVAAYLRENGLNENQFLTLLVERSEGNFMYLHYVLAEIERGFYRHEDLEALPRGLESYYQDHWRRLKNRCGEDTWFDLELPVLAAVTMVKQPVSVDFIAGVLERRDRGRIAATLTNWSQFLHTASLPENPRRKTYRLYHGSFHDFVCRQDEIAEEQVHLRDTSRRIVDFVRKEYQEKR